MVFSLMERAVASAGARLATQLSTFRRVNPSGCSLWSARIAAQIRSRSVSLPVASRWMGLRATDPPRRRFAREERAVAPHLQARELRAGGLRVLARALDVHADAPRDAARLLDDLREQVRLDLDVGRVELRQLAGVGRVGELRRAPIEDAVVEAAPAAQLRGELLLANHENRRVRRLIDVAHQLDQVAVDQVVHLVEEQRPRRERELLADLVDHVEYRAAG